jgi:hypothetical protein
MRGESLTTGAKQLVATNVFSGRSSRTLSVLLDRIKPRTLTEIAKELEAETDRIDREFSTNKLSFAVSLGAFSKALSSLEEQLSIRRQIPLFSCPSLAASCLNGRKNTRSAFAGVFAVRSRLRAHSEKHLPKST